MEILISIAMILILCLVVVIVACSFYFLRQLRRGVKPNDVSESLLRALRLTKQAKTTAERLKIFRDLGFELPDIDNYAVDPGSDVEFEIGAFRWLYLFQLTTGTERAMIMNIAFELHRSCTDPYMHGVGFFSHSFRDSTRNMYYAKAMCLAYRDILIES